MAGKAVVAPPRDSRALWRFRGNGIAGSPVGPVGWMGSLELAAAMVDLGAVLYAMAAVLFERGIKMVFWALEQRKNLIKEREDVGRAKVVAELLAEGIPQTKQDLERWARDKGIPLDKLPPR